MYSQILAKITLFLSFCLLLLFGKLSAQDHTDWTYDKAIYEVNIRQFTPEGTFNAFAEHLDRIEELGAEILWFMPIHPIGQENRLGSLGSYYSIQNFREINPEFGTKEDFKRLVDEIHSRGMYVMLDWVANHTSWDNDLTRSHPEWFAKNTSGSFISPPGTNWSDVIQLDHAQPGLQNYMKEAMRYWVQEFDVDGFRFDAVDFVPEFFWRPYYPNPFNPSTTIAYTINESALVKLTVFDVMGKEVAALVEPQKQQAGNYTVVFDAVNLASGIYRYRLQVGNQVFEKKMTLLK